MHINRNVHKTHRFFRCTIHSCSNKVGLNARPEAVKLKETKRQTFCTDRKNRTGSFEQSLLCYASWLFPGPWLVAILRKRGKSVCMGLLKTILASSSGLNSNFSTDAYHSGNRPSMKSWSHALTAVWRKQLPSKYARASFPSHLA